MRYLCFLVFCPSMVLSQAQGFETDFETYDTAINEIIDPASGTVTCPGLSVQPGGFFERTAGIYDVTLGANNPAALETYTDAEQENVLEYAALSPALQRRCRTFGNRDGGITQSGGFFGPFATRTYLPFTIKKDRRSDTAEQSEPPSRAGFAGQSFRLDYNFDQSDSGIVVLGEFTEVGQRQTIYGRGSDGTAFRAKAQYTRRLNHNTEFGIGVEASRYSVKNFIGNEAQDPVFPVGVSPSAPFVVEEIARRGSLLESFCNNFGEPFNDSQGFGIDVYYTQPIAGAITWELETGLSWDKRSYGFSSCVYRSSEMFQTDTFFVGYIEGEAESQTLDFSTKLQASYTLGPGQIVPRVGLNARRTAIAAYAETEREPDPGATVAVGNGSTGTIPVAASGSALAYDARTVSSLQSELGATYILPIVTSSVVGAVSIDAAYYHEFADTERRVTAQFVGDGRPTPTNFSFGTNPVDPDVFAVKLGFDVEAGDNAAASVWVSRLLGDEVYEATTLGVSLQIAF